MARTFRMRKKAGRYRTKRKLRRKNQLSKRVINASRMTRYTYHAIHSFTTAAGAAVPSDWSYSFPVHFPGYYLNTAGTYGPLTQIPQTIENMFDVSDQYKVVGLKLVWEPYYNYMTINSASGTNTIAVENLIMIVKDYDSIQNISGDFQGLNSGIPSKSFAKRQTVTMKPKGYRGFLNSQARGTAPTTTSTAQASYPPNIFQSLQIRFQNIRGFTTDDYRGTIHLYWDIIFKGINSHT